MPKVTARHFRRCIEDYFEEHELDVVCRKTRSAYALYWADDLTPLARLRPTGRGDEVELFRWDQGRWHHVREFGLTMPLAESLEYIQEDPDGLFFESQDQGGPRHGVRPNSAKRCGCCMATFW